MEKSFDPASGSVPWGKLAALIGAGVAAAFQIGKVPAALPSIQTELGLSLVSSGWIIAIFSLTAAGFAMVIGFIGNRAGHLRFAVAGMAISAAASVAGGFAPNGPTLLASRVVEGFGFLMTVTAIPSLIAGAVPAGKQQFALALWGVYVPVGSFAMMLASGPILEAQDWRVLWFATACFIAVAVVPLVRLDPEFRRPSRRAAQAHTTRADARPTITDSVGVGPATGGLVFGFYAAQYMTLAGFLPLILIQEDGFGTAAAALTGALVVLANALGNGLSGWLHGRGASASRLIVLGSIGMGIATLAVFPVQLPVEVRIAAAVFFSGIGGLVPSSLFSLLPQISKDASSISTVTGMLLQGSAIGQFAGPPAVAAMVVWSGDWSAAIPAMALGAAVCAWGGGYLGKFQP